LKRKQHRNRARFVLSQERSDRSELTSGYTSRLSSGSRKYFDFLDRSHSVFSKETYYDDLRKIHPWLRRPYSRYSGIAYSTLYGGPCSARTEELARPKIKRERLIRQGNYDEQDFLHKRHRFLFSMQNFLIMLKIMRIVE